MKIEYISDFEKENLLRFFFHHLRPGLRAKLMEEYPVTYRKLLGLPIDSAFLSDIRKAITEEGDE